MLEFFKPPFHPSWQHALVAVVCIGLFMVLRFALWYYKAYSQFPGPPIKNFWIGNLDQTMTLDVHEKVSCLGCTSIIVKLSVRSGEVGIVHMVLFSKP